jgi:hypothetical protein
MLSPESDTERKRIQLRRVEETWATMRWVVPIGFLVNWCTWFVWTIRHWEQISQTSSAISAVGLLMFSPFPCVLMFRKQELYPPVAAFLTYILLGLAFGVALGR